VDDQCPSPVRTVNRPYLENLPSPVDANAAGRASCCGSSGGMLLLALVAAAAGVVWLRSATKAALPVLDGDVQISGLSAPVTVRRDAHGVPHIEAASQDDLFVAQAM